ncbi:Alpha-(1,3)-fucosyltransferase 11 [Gryganskiella cystojenkinii]|nr:Alpha-(1,3)-fucosyltransferase 11 [Gryganskiella cystojenkinii]
MSTQIQEKKEYPLLWWGKDEIRNFNGKPVDNCNLPYICRHTRYNDPRHNPLDLSIYNESPLIFVSIYQADDSISAFNKPEDLPPLKDVGAGKKAWVLYGWEPPQWFERKKSVIGKFTYKFNYHPSSDFVYPYFDSSVLDTVLAPPPVTLEHKKAMQKQGFNGGKGLAPIAWIVSNCHAPSGREYYVHQLQKYTDVDIYGGCSNRNREWPKDAHGNDLTDLEITSAYRFYLAFENNNCDFYVTEKLKRTYEAATIPIVDGPNDYGPFAATHNALIQADQYSPKQLAAIVKELGENDEKYLERLRYKYPKDSTHKPTVDDLSPIFVRQWTNRNQSADFLSWPPVYDESMCRACKLAHDVSEGIVKLDPTKRLAPDANCLQKKHFHFTWRVEYHWRLMLLVLTLIAMVSLVLYRNRRTWVPRVKAELLRRWHSGKSYSPLPTLMSDPTPKLV